MPPTSLPRRRLLQAAAAGVFAALPAIGRGQDFPARQVRLIVPQPAGGPTDTVARLLAQKLAERWNQAVVVDNRPGAGSIIGTEAVAKAAPDGYTLGVATVQQIVNPFLFPSLPYDSARDFSPVTLISKADIVLVVNPSVPARSVSELVALAKQQPGKLSWAYAGNGGTGHLAVEMMQRAAAIDVVKVPYKGTPPALQDLLGGQVQAMFDGVVTSLPNIRSGKLRPLAVASLARSQLLPEVPTVAESGYPGFEAVGMAALIGPGGMAPALVARIAADTARVVREPEFEAKMTAMGLQVVGSAPAEFATYMQQESNRLGALIRAAGIRAE